MEVLHSDDKLREEILNDAKTKAERLLKRASGEIKELEEQLKKDIEKFENEMKNSSSKFIEEEKLKIFASIEIEFKKKSLKILGDIIEEIFSQLKDNISLNKEKYKSLIKKLILKAFELLNSDFYDIEIEKKELKNLGSDFLKDSKKKFNIIEKEKINGIIVYDSERKRQVFISLDKFIDNLKEREREKIYNIIFS